MNIGFTGTQEGMTQYQKTYLIGYFKKFADRIDEFHHGDCVGSDFEAASIAHYYNIRIVCHPPIITTKRAYFPYNNSEWNPKDYLVRNKEIVDATNALIVMPKGMTEELRSGTWSTYRYAQTHKPIILVYPNGNKVQHGTWKERLI